MAHGNFGGLAVLSWASGGADSTSWRYLIGRHRKQQESRYRGKDREETVQAEQMSWSKLAFLGLGAPFTLEEPHVKQRTLSPPREWQAWASVSFLYSTLTVASTPAGQVQWSEKWKKHVVLRGWCGDALPPRSLGGRSKRITSSKTSWAT